MMNPLNWLMDTEDLYSQAQLASNKYFQTYTQKLNISMSNLYRKSDIYTRKCSCHSQTNNQQHA